jgi:hypothetical protein
LCRRPPFGPDFHQHRAHPDKPTSFVLPVVFERTVAEAVNDFVGVIVDFV